MVEVMKKVSEKYEENAKVARKNFPKAVVLDVTIKGAMGRLDPDFPLGRIMVPGKRIQALSVNGAWEGLKVFSKKKEIDEKWMCDEKKVGKKRCCKSWGKMEGLMIEGELISVEESKKIFEEIYKETIKERFGNMIEGLKKEAEKRPIVLLDYEEGSEKPFNHVEILKSMLNEV